MVLIILVGNLTSIDYFHMPSFRATTTTANMLFADGDNVCCKVLHPEKSVLLVYLLLWKQLLTIPLELVLEMNGANYCWKGSYLWICYKCWRLYLTMTKEMMVKISNFSESWKAGSLKIKTKSCWFLFQFYRYCI